MDNQEIRQHTDALPTTALGKEPIDDEAWEGDENGAHFIFTRNHMHGTPYELLTVSLSGSLAGRRSLRNDFCRELGTPKRLETYPEDPDQIDWISWLIPKR